MAAGAVAREQAGLEGEGGLLAPTEVDLRRAARVGLLGGVATMFVSAIGMVVAFKDRKIVDGLSFGRLLLLAMPTVTGFLAARPPPQLEGYAPPRRGPRNVGAGLLGGVLAGLVSGLFLLLVENVDVRAILVNVSPQLTDILAFGQGVLPGAGLIVGTFALLGLVGGALHLIGARWRGALVASLLWVLVFGLLQVLVGQLLGSLGVGAMRGFLYLVTGGLSIPGAAVVGVATFALSAALHGRRNALAVRLREMPPASRRRVVIVAVAGLVLVLAVLPRILGSFLSEVLNFAGVFLLMALGLNIVVGFAGLLDLGYVAFFAVGAYSTAVVMSPSSPRFSPELIFWEAIPFIILAAAAAGLLVGTPVLRMRGDYLAIVTLGFGEIARLLFLSDWLKPTFGGAQGITRIPDLTIGPLVLRGSQSFFYAIFAFVLLAAYASYALQDSRMGRAWMAMREDESVAEAMGVNIVAAKLWAFVVGAILAGFGGALFAIKIGSIFPHSFSITVSITVLIIVIVGGLSSVPGVILAALLLAGLPELLREFEEFKFLIYGALLIFMMLRRPEGFVPSRRRARELHEEEVLQDAWVRMQREEQEAAPASGA